MVFVGTRQTMMLIHAAGIHQRLDCHPRPSKRIDCAQQLVRVVDRRSRTIRIGVGSHQARRIVIDSSSRLSSGAVLWVNYHAVRQCVRSVVIKILCDLAATVSGSEQVSVNVIRIAGSDPFAVQVVPNLFAGEVAGSRRYTVSLSVVTELDDARSERGLLRCTQDERS